VNRTVKVSLVAVLLLFGGWATWWILGPEDAGKRRDARAEEVYTARCSYCHDVEGAIGVMLDARVLRDYGSPRRLFDYVRLAMPYDAPRAMADDELWLTVEHLLRTRGLVGEGVRVGPENAGDFEW
jgi:hypothetical protein